MDKDFKTIVILWLSVLTLAWVGVVIFWQPICERAAMTVLGSVGKAAAREVIHYRPSPPMQDRRRTELEEAVAREGGRSPGETLDEALARIEREALAVDFWWENTSDVDE